MLSSSVRTTPVGGLRAERAWVSDSSMNCEQAQQLFDAYLDGELSPALATELGTHRVHCAECRRALALMEVTGHIVASDRDPVFPRGDLANRLAACVESPAVPRRGRLRRAAYIGGPLAAAALVALAFVGVFDNRRVNIVLSHKEVQDSVRTGPITDRAPAAKPAERVLSVDERLVREWFEQTRRNLETKRESGESLQRAFELTVSQLLDILQRAQDGTTDTKHYPGADPSAPVSPIEPTPADDKSVEDL